MGIDKVGATGELDRRLWVGKIFWSFVSDYKVSESESVSTRVEEEDVVPPCRRNISMFSFSLTSSPLTTTQSRG